MKQLFKLIAVITIACVQPSAFAYAHDFNCMHPCFKDSFASYQQLCPSGRCSDYPQADYKVDNACVDFCLDYEHTLSECQKACSN